MAFGARLFVSAFAVALTMPRLALAEGTGTATAAKTVEKSAQDLAEAAARLYKAEKFRAALELFQNAYALAPRPSLLFNQAKCHERLAEWDEALSFYQRYLEAAPDAPNRGEVSRIIADIKKKEGDVQATYLAKMGAGKKAYERGDYEGAIAQFKDAFAIRRAPAPIYNTARCFEKMARYEQAIAAYQKYLELSPSASDRADVEERVRSLNKSIADRFQDLSISSAPQGADVYLDDVGAGLRGQTDLHLKVPPGPHTLFLEANGYEPVKKPFVMPDDQPLRLQFQLTKLDRVGFLEVRVNRGGARIFVDGAIIGLSPFAQKWMLPEGPHQVLVETEDYRRLSQTVTVEMNKTVRAGFRFRSPDDEDESEPSDLAFWGETLLLAGSFVAIAGIVGPIAYEKAALHGTPYAHLGPDKAQDQGPFYRGPLPEGSPEQRSNRTLKTLQGIQVGSIIGASALGAGGLALFVVHWIRGDEGPHEGTVTGVGLPPTKDGAFLQISGRF